ncbi:UDP-3-O-(3-hydroxymyristoyl)glucosamine N-acyltransferase [uncultured archaeon]|nr:UDP-3-O-(3-hydroxymyristoyl)glucosamine N-acyltransferase [uncultured archaeon]
MSDKKKWKKPVIKHSKLTRYNYIVQYPENLEFGKNFDIGTFTYVNCKYGVKIEDNVQIGSHCSIYSYSTIDNKKGKVILKKNSKIGTHSTIMPNVTIGENSTVAAYSFVNKSIPKNEIWAGIPAKFKTKIKASKRLILE